MSLFNEPGEQGREALSHLSGKRWKECRARDAEVRVHSKGLSTWTCSAQQESWQQSSEGLQPSQLPSDSKTASTQPCSS